MAGKAVEHPVDGRADGVEIEVGLREGHRPFRHRDLGLGLGHRLGARSDHHVLERGLGRLLLEAGRGHRELGLEDLLLGNLVAGEAAA